MSYLGYVASLAAALEPTLVACRTYFPDQESNLGPLCWEHRVLATGPPGKFLCQSSISLWKHKQIGICILTPPLLFCKKATCYFVLFCSLLSLSVCVCLHTVDLQYCVNFCCTGRWLSYTCLCIFFIFFSIMVCPLLYGRTVSTHSLCDSLHLLTPDSQSVPPSPYLGTHKSVLCISVSVSAL